MKPKTRALTVLLTEDQYTKAATEAERRGMGLSTLARTLLLEAIASAKDTKGTPAR